jgi:predicted dienelactone hydrolase
VTSGPLPKASMISQPGPIRAAIVAVLLSAPIQVALAQLATVPADVFPKPTGPYQIGVREYLWVDQQRGEPYTKDPSDKRHVMVRIWYPAEPAAGAPFAPYITDKDEFTKPETFVPVLGVITHSVADAPISSKEARWPVLVYHHGGSWTRFSATFATEWLASYGYVVVGVDHNGFNQSSSYPGGYKFLADTLTFPAQTGDLAKDNQAAWDYLTDPVFGFWVGDAKFVLDQIEALDRTSGGPFAGHLALDRIGMFGWSFGGATSIEMTRVDARVKAAVDQDGRLFGGAREQGVGRPIFLMHHGIDDSRGIPEASRPVMKKILRQVRGWDSLFLAHSTGDRYELTIAKTDHGHFSDLMYFFPRDTAQLAPARAHEIINAYTLAFFDRYLKGRKGSLLDGGPPPFPEATFRKLRHPGPAVK